MLCEFANYFPRNLAQLLDRDRHLTRNFREETATDLLMMGLISFQPLGIRVDFPDEKATGADMDWIFAAPHEVGGGVYLRLMIQAKRCKEQKLKGEQVTGITIILIMGPRRAAKPRHWLPMRQHLRMAWIPFLSTCFTIRTRRCREQHRVFRQSKA